MIRRRFVFCWRGLGARMEKPALLFSLAGLSWDLVTDLRQVNSWLFWCMVAHALSAWSCDLAGEVALT